MNIIEAIKSGKPFKRAGWVPDAYVEVSNPDARWPDFSPLAWVNKSRPRAANILDHAQDILADDWELKPEPKKPREFWIHKELVPMRGRSDEIPYVGVATQISRPENGESFIKVREVIE